MSKQANAPGGCNGEVGEEIGIKQGQQDHFPQLGHSCIMATDCLEPRVVLRCVRLSLCSALIYGFAALWFACKAEWL